VNRLVTFRLHVAIIISILVSLSAVIFYVFVGESVLEGQIDFQFYADSLTYEELYYSNYFDNIWKTVGFGGNYFGPILILKSFNGSRVCVLLFNCAIFLISIKLIVSSSNIRPRILLFLLILNPITFFSLVSVNKEIISLLVCALVIKWIYSRWFGYVFFAFFISFMVRWQLSIFVLFLVFSMSNLNFIKKLRFLYILISLIFISIVYYKLGHLFENVNAVAQAGALTNQGSGIYSLFNRLQAQGFYFLVFVPKTLHAIFGLISNIFSIFNPTNIYNDVIITINAVVSFSVFCFLFLRNRFRLRNDLVFASILYCMIFSLSPIYSPRYFYPVFIFLAIILASRSLKQKG